MSMILGNSLLAASLLLGQAATTPSGRSAPVEGEKVVQVQSGPSTPVEGEKIIQVQNTPGQPMAQPQPATRPILGFFRNGSGGVTSGGTTFSNNTTEERPIWNKLTGWLRRDNNQDQQQQQFQQQQFQQQPLRGNVIRETTPSPTPTPPALDTKPAANDYYKRMPSPMSKTKAPAAEPLANKETTQNKDIKQVSIQQVAPPKTKSPIRSELANSIGRDEKFEWITGQLEQENGNYVLYYATPETIDKYHGRVVLLPEKANLKQFRTGELISVRGNLTQRQTNAGIVPIYHVTLASRIERPKQ